MNQEDTFGLILEADADHCYNITLFYDYHSHVGHCSTVVVTIIIIATQFFLLKVTRIVMQTLHAWSKDKVNDNHLSKLIFKYTILKQHCL